MVCAADGFQPCSLAIVFSARHTTSIAAPGATTCCRFVAAEFVIRTTRLAVQFASLCPCLL